MATRKKVTAKAGSKPAIWVMPYEWIVGQDQVKMALEIAWVAPQVGGVLLSGQRGTGKSTVVRAFTLMVNRRLPVTLPINATEDRVVGGWRIEELLQGKHKWMPGLLEEANGNVLYVDEVNLLDDHIVNLLLDVTSTGVLVVQREGRDETKPVRFTLIGTMNPSEGLLRPQLIDRFSLCANVSASEDRAGVLEKVLLYDAALTMDRNGNHEAAWDEWQAAIQSDQTKATNLAAARSRLQEVTIPDAIYAHCVSIGKLFGVEGHRADFLMALAGKALAAMDHQKAVSKEHLKRVAPLVLQHRRAGGQAGGWSKEDEKRLNDELAK